MSANDKTKYKIKSGIIEYGDDTNLALVSNNRNDNNVLVLNTSAIEIYQLIRQGFTIEDIQESFQRKYFQIPFEQIKNDIDDVISSLRENEVIEKQK